MTTSERGNRVKITKVAPIFKTSDKTSTENYKPISLLYSIGKIFEKLLHIRIVRFFAKIELFASEQIGFKKSCYLHAINTVTDYTSEKIKN